MVAAFGIVLIFGITSIIFFGGKFLDWASMRKTRQYRKRAKYPNCLPAANWDIVDISELPQEQIQKLLRNPERFHAVN